MTYSMGAFCSPTYPGFAITTEVYDSQKAGSVNAPFSWISYAPSTYILSITSAAPAGTYYF